MLVLDGAPVELDAHLDRLAASLEVLYGEAPPAGVEELARERAEGLELGRLRLTVAPSPDGLGATAVSDRVDPGLPFRGREGGAELRGFSLPGGLGPHKWVDRSLLPAAATRATPLLLDAGGEVLEAGRANVFAVFGGALATPPADGRILPGITRATTIEIARGEGIEVEERWIGREELLGADEVFLTGSVRGVESARSLDEVPLGIAGEVGALLSSLLAERYGTGRTVPLEASRSAWPGTGL